jgi:hypothetical protein
MYALFRSEDNFIVDPKQIGLYSVDRIQLAQDRIQWRALMNTVTNFRVL